MTYQSCWACEQSDQSGISKGTKVFFKGAWGWIPGGNLEPNLMAAEGTEPGPTFDIEFTTDKYMILADILAEVEQRMLVEIKKQGGKEIRFYFIEFILWGNKHIEFMWGT